MISINFNLVHPFRMDSTVTICKHAQSHTHPYNFCKAMLCMSTFSIQMCIFIDVLSCDWMILIINSKSSNYIMTHLCVYIFVYQKYVHVALLNYCILIFDTN